MSTNVLAFAALGDPTRRTIFERLAEGPMAVGTIAGPLPVSRSAVSQHLKILKLAGLVTDRQVGNRRLYSIDSRGLDEVVTYFDTFWKQSLGAFKRAAEQHEGETMAADAAGAVDTSVRTTIIVEAPIERAFSVFTAGIGSWWPADHHILKAELAEMVFEPRAGGHVYDRGVDGSECRWARVLAYDPPHRLVISWDISLQWQLESDPSRTSAVEVVFVSETPDRTRVELEHRHLDRHGDGWEKLRDAVGSPDGWLRGLEAFAKAAAA